MPRAEVRVGDLTIRGLDETALSRLGARASEHGRSPEDEARALLERTLAALPLIGGDEDLGSFAQRIFAPLGGFDVPSAERPTYREPPRFDDIEDVTLP